MIDEGIIRQLADPGCYPGGSGSVVQYQTHLSLVCVVGDFAYKLKKALRLPFVDFSSLSKRKQVCQDEVRLNARLSPDTYLGVVPLYESSGSVSFCDDHGGEIVDYAVLMARLPAGRMMDVLLEQNAVTRAHIGTVATRIANFHREVALDGASEEAGRAADRLRAFALANFDETDALRGEIFDRGLHLRLRQRAEEDFDQYLPLLGKRAREGWVVDGHGDLHARNICLSDPVVIYDCLEFSRELRVADVAAENAFLLMDLRYRGQVELGAAYLEHYLAISGDAGQHELLPMLIRYRAMVRAKVAALAAGEHEIEETHRGAFVNSARRHLNLMAATAVEQAGPSLICACGLPASGKSYVFEALAQASGWPYHATDRVRKELAKIPPNQRAPAEFYSREASERTYAETLRRASESFNDGPVLVDANFASAALRGAAGECARRAGARIVFVWFQADEQVVEQRMGRRSEDDQEVSDANLEIYRKLSAKFEPPSADEGGTLIVTRAEGDRDQQVAAILRQLL